MQPVSLATIVIAVVLVGVWIVALMVFARYSRRNAAAPDRLRNMDRHLP